MIYNLIIFILKLNSYLIITIKNILMYIVNYVDKIANTYINMNLILLKYNKIIENNLIINYLYFNSIYSFCLFIL